MHKIHVELNSSYLYIYGTIGTVRGAKNEHLDIRLTLNSIAQLRALSDSDAPAYPPLARYSSNCYTDSYVVWVPKANCWVGLDHFDWLEGADSHEEDYSEPFRILPDRLAAPTSDELKPGDEKRKVITRWVNLYPDMAQKTDEKNLAEKPASLATYNIRTCPVCLRPTLACLYEDVGAKEPRDQFALYCPECGLTSYAEIYDERGATTRCPYCGISCAHHLGVPPALMAKFVNLEQLGQFTRLGKSAHLLKLIWAREAGEKIGQALDNIKLLEVKCEKCGQPIYCCHKDIGATDYYDNFWHVCRNPNCDFIQHHERYSGLGQENKGDTDCPFCGNNVIEY